MKLHARIVAGTALGVLMASAPAWADEPLAAGFGPAKPILLAQTDVPPEEQAAPQDGAEEAPAAAEEAPAGDQPAAEEAQPAPQAAEPEPAPAAEPAPAPEPEAAPTAEPQPETAPAEAGDAVEQDEPVMDAPEVQPQPQDVSPDVAPESDQPTEAAEPAPAPEPEAAPTAEPQPEPAPAEAGDAVEQDEPVMDAPEVQPQPQDVSPDVAPEPDQPTEADEPVADQPAVEPPPAQPVPEGEVAPAPEPEAEAPAPGDQVDQLPENAAPILDSAKQPVGADGDQPPATETPDGQAVEEPVGPPPRTDEEAQSEDVVPAEIESITATEGRRIDREQFRRERRERPEGAEILREIGERVIYQLGGETFVEGYDRGRLQRNAEEVYYDELPRGRVRETIVRPNGVQIVTVYNRFGDVVRRSRVMPDGREVVLTYVDDRRYQRAPEWRDPGRDLPPLRLRIPVRDYILDAERVEDPQRYYQFLDQPPVERVERLYSIDDVRRSARLRDTVRRVDLDTINFETGSADITRSEVDELEGIATAMHRMLEENPAETFLIEGHTDAVGSDVANLALSDERAESVANALTRYYDIPPENLVTQGYGERYLKISTEGPSRQNRRVAIRRITPLVAPIASAQ